MPQLIDIAEVEAAMEEFRARSLPLLNDEGSKGVIARLQYEAAAALTYWRVKEINRGTKPPAMMEAMSLFFAATIAGEIKQSVPSNMDVQFSVANEIIDGLAQGIARILTAQHEWGESAIQINGKEAGTA